MNLKYVLLICLMPTLAVGQKYTSHTVAKDRVSIPLPEGTLNIIPLSDYAIRIQIEKEPVKETRELILINKLPVPAFKFSESPSTLQVMTKAITVKFDKQSGAMDFSDPAGKSFLKEKPGSRKLIPGTTMGEPSFTAEQTFDSPADEYLFGLGQFQDGYFNLRNVSRKLIQVNSQIAVPFVYSSRGYGILWHQYGLTQFNPADNIIALVKKEAASDQANVVEVTTTSGTQRVSQSQSLHTGNFTLEADGIYSLMLDLGDMDNRHLLVIDDSVRIDQSNLWLPPSVSTLVNLKRGQHRVQVVCNTTNKPKLTWKLTVNETTFRSPDAKAMDYVVFYGKNAEEVIHQYRKLSGEVPMLPLWAYGFWQCRERYTSGEHLVGTVKEFRKRNLPVDVIVQDWQYWGQHGWGVPKFDESNYPNPAGFIRELHNLNTHFSISVWENLEKKSDVAKEYLDKNLYIADSKWIDIFNPVTQQTHWQALNKNLFSLGVDSWWMDATEPENDGLTGMKTYFGPGDFYRLMYPLFVSKAIYEGQRQTNPQKRVAILTRSAFAGQQRFGTINWSGDIGGTWDAFRRQIVAGLNYSLTGMPFWTTDIGGFFRPGASQYTDEKYQELLTRWFQLGTFNTIFRIHGYQTETEPWKYGSTVETNMRSMLNLRYRLMPYIYSEAWQVTANGSTIMRPLVMDFGTDAKAIGQPFEYMFGKSFLVSPVTEAGISEAQVYLPATTSWYDFWTGRKWEGGQTIKTAAPLDKIPVFVKAGSIVPMVNVAQSTAEIKTDTLQLRIYAGADGRFDLYSDEGDNYNYEKGQYKVVPLTWDEQKQILTIDKQKGTYKGALTKQVFNITWVAGSQGGGADDATRKYVTYSGKKLTVSKK
jgi:alpha-D-xyloside xylohydrolase